MGSWEPRALGQAWSSDDQVLRLSTLLPGATWREKGGCFLWLVPGGSGKVTQSKPALFACVIKEKRFGTLEQELLGNENKSILEIRLTSGVQMGPLCSLWFPRMGCMAVSSLSPLWGLTWIFGVAPCQERRVASNSGCHSSNCLLLHPLGLCLALSPP